MEPFTKKFRAHTWENKDFAGTVDWAVDLWTFNPEDDSGVDHGSRDGPSLHPGPCNGTYATLDAIEKDMAKMAPYCRQFHTLEVLETILNSTLATHDSLMAHSYDHNFGQYADAVVSNAPDAVKNFMYGHDNGAMEEQSVFQQFASLEPYFTRARNRFLGLPALGDRPVQQSRMSDADYQAGLREWTAQSSLRGYLQTLLDAVHFSVADVIYLRQMDYWAASLAGGNVAEGAGDAAKGLRHGNNFGGLHADEKPIIVQDEIPTLFGTYKVVLEQETLTRSVPAKFPTIAAAKARWDAIFAVAAAVEHMNVITTFKGLQLALPGRPQEIICTP